MNSSTGLAAGTLVTTPNSDKKIEEIKAGSLVLSGIGYRKTSCFEVKEAKSKLYNGPILEITIKTGHKMQAIPNHICFGHVSRKYMAHLFQEGNVIIAAFSSLGKSDRIGHSIFVVPHVLKSEEIIRDPDHVEELALAVFRTNGGADIYRFATFVGDSRLETPYYFLPALSLEKN